MTFPSEMTEASRWVCWKYAERNGKRTKVPINAKTGREASSTDPETWADPEAAQEKTKAYNRLKEEIERLYAEWETLSEAQDSGL